VTAAERRRDAVARIVRTRRIATQDELLGALAAAGFRATQATLSRDLARLGARRVSRREGGTVYELADGAAEGTGLGALRGLVARIGANASLVIIRTHPGSAPAIARAIDLAEIREVLGTIAGDDTIFVATDGARAPRALLERLRTTFGR
jgi:transcriptional regulator of arginine metabolism